MRTAVLIALFLLTYESGRAEPIEGTRPLRAVHAGTLRTHLPAQSLLLDEPPDIERFLDAVDERPPDWAAIYGHGGHDHGERLFALNRERDEIRNGRPILQQRLTFLWPGELSDYVPAATGFKVAIGPASIPTRWGMVRFKPEDVPSPLIAVPSPALVAEFQRLRAQDRKIEVTVAMTGRLVPEESLIYDFSHEEAGRGLIMPVVRIEHLDYFLIE